MTWDNGVYAEVMEVEAAEQRVYNLANSARDSETAAWDSLDSIMRSVRNAGDAAIEGITFDTDSLGPIAAKIAKR